MPESPTERTPGPIRTAVDEALARREARRKESFPTITDSMTVTTRFTLARWLTLVGMIVGATVSATWIVNGWYRNIMEEHAVLRADIERSKAENGSLSGSLQKLTDTIASLNITVAELRVEVREMKYRRQGGEP